MRNFSHWYTVETPGYWDNGEYRRSYLSYPVYSDEMTPYEHEAKRIFAQRRQLGAEYLVVDSYVQLAKKRAELAQLMNNSVRVIESPQNSQNIPPGDRRGRW